VKGLSVLTALFIAVSAYAYTWPGAYPYDGLITKDRAGLPQTPGALHLHGGFFYVGILNKGFYPDGEVIEDGVDNYKLGIPVDLGYAVNERWGIDLTFQILKRTNGNTSEFGIGDMWFKARALWETGMDFYFGPRVAVKLPVGDETKLLGDGQADIDIGAVGAKYGETHFRLNGQLGFRYRLAYKYTVAGVEHDEKPGIMIYSFMEPGVGIGRANKFSIYAPIAFDFRAKTKLDGDSQDMTGGYTFAIGVKPAYAIDQNNTLNLLFLFPLFGKNADDEVYIGFTADSYIPL